MRKMVLTLQERIFVAEQYFTHKSYKTVSEIFQVKFPDKDVSTASYTQARQMVRKPLANSSQTKCAYV